MIPKCNVLSTTKAKGYVPVVKEDGLEQTNSEHVHKTLFHAGDVQSVRVIDLEWMSGSNDILPRADWLLIWIIQ